MYAGKKSQLRPLHDALIELALSLGDDVKISPCETIVPLHRKHVFAQIKPTTLIHFQKSKYHTNLSVCWKRYVGPSSLQQVFTIKNKHRQ